MTEIEKALQAALDKALRESAEVSTSLKNSVIFLSKQVETLQKDISNLNQQASDSANREMVLQTHCENLTQQYNQIMAEMETLIERLEGSGKSEGLTKNIRSNSPQKPPSFGR